ncbi:MAG: hypothetical protein ACTSRA_03205 [Promethearchaeota archaeon]
MKNKEAFEFVKKKLIYIGFKDITTREFFGKRGSDLMLEYILPGSIFRIHLRAYIISDRVFFLIHKEPIVSKNVNDLYFHLRGFIERFSQDINKYFSFPSGSTFFRPNYKNNGELSNYQQGCLIFSELIKNKCPELMDYLNFYPDNQDFLLFSIKFGNITKMLPLEMLINEFDEHLKCNNFLNIDRNIHSMLEIIGFKGLKPILSKDFIRSIYSNHPENVNFENSATSFMFKTSEDEFLVFFLIVKDPNYVSLFFNNLNYEWLHNNTIYALVICTFALKLDDNKKLKKLKKFKKKNYYLSFITIQEFREMFQKFIKSPFSIKDLLTMIDKYPIIERDDLRSTELKLIDENEKLEIINSVLKYLNENPGWNKKPNLLKALNQEFSFLKDKPFLIDHALDLLNNPLIGLIQMNKKKNEIKGIENEEELNLKLNHLKKIIDGF